MESSVICELKILDLPPEIITKIFQYLNYGDLKSASLVCKFFYEISRSTKKFLSKAILTLTNIEGINLFMRNRSHPYPNIHLYRINLIEIEEFFKEYGKHIEEITLNHIEIEAEDLIMTLKQLPNLKSLNLYQCEISSASKVIENNDTTKIYDINAPKLKSLTIGSKCNQQQIQFFSKITSNIDGCIKIVTIDGRFPDISALLIPNLKEIHLQSNNQIFEANLIRNCINLNTLALRNFHLSHFNEFLQEQVTLENLICLDLSESHNINDRTLCLIAKKCKNLTAIALNNCHYLNDSSIIILSELKKLQVFHGTCCCSLSSQAITDGIAKFKNENMETLVLAKLNQLSENAIIQCVMNFPNLKHLNLKGCKTGVTNKSLQLILQNLNHLQLLDVGYCKVTDEAFVEYQFLDVEDDKINRRYYVHCDSNLEIKHLLSNLKGLHVLNLQTCNISNNLLLTQFKFLEMKELILSECYRMLETGFEAIGKNCPSIEKLSIIGCKRINGDQCAGILLKYFKRLKEIYTCKCNSPKYVFEAKNSNILNNLLINELYCESCRFCYFDNS